MKVLIINRGNWFSLHYIDINFIEIQMLKGYTTLSCWMSHTHTNTEREERERERERERESPPTIKERKEKQFKV
jgi:hypothetical protein